MPRNKKAKTTVIFRKETVGKKEHIIAVFPKTTVDTKVIGAMMGRGGGLVRFYITKYRVRNSLKPLVGVEELSKGITLLKKLQKTGYFLKIVKRLPKGF